MAVIQSLFGRQAGGGPDPFWTSVVSLLWFNGNLTDQRGKTWTANGMAATSAVQSRWGGGSLLLASGDSLQTAASTDFDFPADFTVEMWVYVTARGSSIELFTRNGVLGGLSISLTGSGSITVAQHGTGTILGAAGAVPLNTWTHVAVTREAAAGGTIRAYIGGTAVNGLTSASNDFTAASAPTFIGPPTGGGNLYIDDFRVTKGVARYVAGSFTVPSAQFPNF